MDAASRSLRELKMSLGLNRNFEPERKVIVRACLTSLRRVAEALLLLRRKKHTTTEKPRPPRYLSTLIKHPL